MQHHPNIVNFLGVYYAPHSTLPTLVMEYLPRTLTSCLESNSLKIQMKYAILLDVAKGLIYLHQKNPCVIHRDLTANNVLLTHNLLQAKISDLGVSRKWADTMLTKAPGNTMVMPPEALKDNPVYDHKLDVFSYGCLILHVLTGQFPRPTNQFKPKPSRKSADDYIKVPECNRRSYYIEKLPQVSDLTSLVKQCLSDDPTKRPEMKIASSIIEGFISHVVVDGVEEGFALVDVISDPEKFSQTTIKQLKKKILETIPGLVQNPQHLNLLFNEKILDDTNYWTKEENMLHHYKIQKHSIVTVRCYGQKNKRVPVPPLVENKEYPTDCILEFTDDPDCIDPYSNSTRRVKMSCGHAVEPNSLTAYCRSLLSQHKSKFTCPAITDSGKHCNKEWEYAEVRLAALLTEEENIYFESKMSEHALSLLSDIKECPLCRTFAERIDANNPCAKCHACSTRKGYEYTFCWYCLEEWKEAPSSKKCGNPLCIHPDLLSLRDAPDVILCGKSVPNRRACPTCGKIVEIIPVGCKFVLCPRCKNEYCFLCLKSKNNCLKAAPQSWFKECAEDVASKQTYIPSAN
uniref:Protein kinase domain-containing protein n=1 Tax=Amphimedon queenslandica TaxID=400682 RepID=A0A1X7U2D1_AMPQE